MMTREGVPGRPHFQCSLLLPHTLHVGSTVLPQTLWPPTLKPYIGSLFEIGLNPPPG